MNQLEIISFNQNSITRYLSLIEWNPICFYNWS